MQQVFSHIVGEHLEAMAVFLGHGLAVAGQHRPHLHGDKHSDLFHNTRTLTTSFMRRIASATSSPMGSERSTMVTA